MIKKTNLEMAVILILPLFFFQTANAAPIHFNVISGSLLVTTNPGANYVTDVTGLYGSMNQQYYVQNFVFNATSGMGVSDTTLGTLDYTVNFTGAYKIYDISTNGLIATIPFTSSPFHEYGTIDTNGNGLLGSDNTLMDPTETGITGQQYAELLNGTTISAAPDRITYNNPAFNNEMVFILPKEFGGGTIFGTANGSLNIVPTPIPAAGWLFMSALASLGFIGRRKK